MGGFEGLPGEAAELIEYIEDAYHRHTALMLTHLSALLSEALVLRGEECQELYHLGRLMEQLRALLASHANLEEARLFREASVPQKRRAAAARIEELAGRDLEALDRICHDMRMVTLGYTGMPRGCPEVTPLLAGLRELEADSRRHFYVEREILVPLLRDGGPS